MKCPSCGSLNAVKNGHRNGIQAYLCRSCNRQFQEEIVGRYSKDAIDLSLKISDATNPYVSSEVTGASKSSIYRWRQLDRHG
ncbi:IS1/IS1595 family N-terminal zinc-binding domain-containing protein [Leptolyngbya sp. AN02str]|uniref:IS1/IS1595 family N-terminal zinc-binding domain-containing protein n=1 Tax=Leptolyngbya sp. AN02str TaxID=3423363 RepID=UPI003D323C0E